MQKIVSYKPQPFDLTVLKKFNQGLVSGFDSERSIRDLKPTSTAYLAHIAGQWQDMFDAYHYAEYIILPAIQTQGIAAISPEQLLQWLNQIHLRTASTLAKDLDDKDVVAGEYVKQTVGHWHNGRIITDLIFLYFSKDVEILQKSIGYFISHMLPEKFNNFKQQIKEQKKREFQTYCLLLFQAFDVDKEDAKNFIQLLDNIREAPNSNIQVPTNHTMMPQYYMDKFIHWYHNNPSVTEKQIVNKLGKFFLPPEKLPQAMQDFAINLLEQWRACDPNDIDQLTKLLCYAFYQLTDIHPYFNANGRSATLLINIILVSLGKPSILMRNPQERKDANSSYSQAIKFIDSDQNYLINHLKQRVLEAEEGKAYANPKLAEIISLRVKLHNTITEIKSLFPEVTVAKLDELYENYLETIPKDTTDEAKISWLKSCITDFTKFKDQCATQKPKSTQTPTPVATCQAKTEDKNNIADKIKSLSLTNEQSAAQKQKSTQIPSPIITRQYQQDEINNIADKIKSLTGHYNYELNTYRNNGLTILLTLNDKEKALALVKFFNATNVMKASKKINPATQAHVVQLENINPEKLMQITKPIGTNEDKPVVSIITTPALQQ